MSKKLRELVGVSEAVGHGDRELVCVSDAGRMGAAGREAEELQRQPVLRVGRDLVREKPPGSPSPSGPGRGFPGPRRQRSNDGPRCDGSRRGILPDSASAALGDLTSWLATGEAGLAISG